MAGGGVKEGWRDNVLYVQGGDGKSSGEWSGPRATYNTLAHLPNSLNWPKWPNSLKRPCLPYLLRGCHCRSAARLLGRHSSATE
jgi:hypothetical protein